MRAAFSLLGLALGTWILLLLIIINQVFVVGYGPETGLWGILFMSFSSMIFKWVTIEYAT